MTLVENFEAGLKLKLLILAGMTTSWMRTRSVLALSIYLVSLKSKLKSFISCLQGPKMK